METILDATAWMSALALTFTSQNITFTGILVFVTIALSIYAESNPEVKRRWMLNPYQVAQRGEYYRFITSGFIHSGYIHLAFNMLVLHSFGNVMEYIFGAILGGAGSIVFLVFYLLAIVVSDIPTFLKYRDSPHYNSLGASGGVSAIVFAAILFNPTAPIGFIFIPVSFPGFVIGILYLFYTAYMARNSNSFINHDAHLYGSLFGIVFCIAIYPPVISRFIEQVSNWGGFF